MRMRNQESLRKDEPQEIPGQLSWLEPTAGTVERAKESVELFKYRRKPIAPWRTGTEGAGGLPAT